MKKSILMIALLAACAGIPEMGKAMQKGKASAGLIRLATTGNPETLHKELGGKIVSSKDIGKKAKSLLKGKEHLAPKALITPKGDIYAMVAPTITKDHFVYSHKGTITRMDVGFTEKTNTPFVVTTVTSDGGASIWEQIGHFFDNLF